MNINFIECFRIIPRSIISLIFLFLVTKLIGKKQVSELSLFDYVIGISIGNFSAEMTMNFEGQYINGIVAILIFGLSAYLVSILTQKSIIARRIIIGVPTILMKDGKLIEYNIKKVKLDMNDFLEECRINGYFDISQIEYAIMEANGKISILPKSEYKSLTPKDMKIKTDKESLVSNIIIDGKYMKHNIENMNKTIEWINHELKIKGYNDIKNILLATLDINDKITIYEKNNSVKVYSVLE